jgi:endonuclease YncB( thermonuclease family)
MINGKRVSVMSNPNRDRTDITGEVQDEQGRDLSRLLLRAGAAPFAVAPAYTLSEYSECLHRIAEREAKAEGVGIWRHQ